MEAESWNMFSKKTVRRSSPFITLFYHKIPMVWFDTLYKFHNGSFGRILKPNVCAIMKVHNIKSCGAAAHSPRRREVIR